MRVLSRPTDLANCGLWLDASQLALADGAAVASWTDLSGNARHATQATAVVLGFATVATLAVGNLLR